MTQCANVYDVIYCKKSVMLKMVYNKKKIQIFGMNMPLLRVDKSLCLPKLKSITVLLYDFSFKNENFVTFIFVV